jgi:hypothetical protein
MFCTTGFQKILNDIVLSWSYDTRRQKALAKEKQNTNQYHRRVKF